MKASRGQYDADAAAKERADVLNQADGLVFEAEKQLKELGTRFPNKMAPINEALENLKKAHGAQDVDGCKSGIEALNTAFQAASQEMYAANKLRAVLSGSRWRCRCCCRRRRRSHRCGL